MADIVDKTSRSRMMSGIRGTNTQPEIRIRKLLHHQGFRFRLHSSSLEGKPDIVLSRFKAIIFVNGCFWHGHNCSLFKMPSTRTDFWKIKIGRNRERDGNVKSSLRAKNWRVATIWECALKGRNRIDEDIVIKHLGKWVRGKAGDFELGGRKL